MRRGWHGERTADTSKNTTIPVMTKGSLSFLILAPLAACGRVMKPPDSNWASNVRNGCQWRPLKYMSNQSANWQLLFFAIFVSG